MQEDAKQFLKLTVDEQMDEKTILNSIKMNPEVYFLLDEKLKLKKEFIEETLLQDHFLFLEMDEKIKSDENYVLFALNLAGELLEVMDEKFQSNKKFVEISPLNKDNKVDNFQ
jgi:hypothetical protein